MNSKGQGQTPVSHNPKNNELFMNKTFILIIVKSMFVYIKVDS